MCDGEKSLSKMSCSTWRSFVPRRSVCKSLDCILLEKFCPANISRGLACSENAAAHMMVGSLVALCFMAVSAAGMTGVLKNAITNVPCLQRENEKHAFCSSALLLPLTLHASGATPVH